ncbi:hypothetical protein pETSU_020 [Edwardsiella phage pEt-SU]|uniref:Uncharacterized protein n=1 Tax=Edwardsiella phage pEt-SU TaxID=2562142 RepID=A0A4D6DW53_9CAUD|nr:hypothetical protein HOV39_gp020 [Edwardsiella phage pEt-SU]QBZ70601.1 hypothetical protein pETSU_020 [Edwardsiella phage pEt-SU]
MLFTIKQLVEHVQSTSGLVGNRWVPIRPLQLTGLGGLKQRIVHAYRVLKGELDVVDWKVGTSTPRELRALLSADSSQELSAGLSPTSIKVISVGVGDSAAQKPVKAKMDWVKHSGTNPFWTGKVQTDEGNITLRLDQDARKVILSSSNISTAVVTYLVE